MNHSRKLFALSSLSLAFIASSAFLTGCAGVDGTEQTTESVEQSIVDQSGARELPVQNELQIDRASDSKDFAVAPNAAWKEIAPGVFESDENGSRVFMGLEGHQWAVDHVEKDLAALRVRGAEDPTVEEAAEKLEAELARLDDTMKSIAAQPSTPQAISCNIGFYTGPSSPVSGSYGSAALAQVSCSSGCQTFTISAQACTNYGCTPVYSSSRFVCATPWTYGVSMTGSYGASCSSSASVSPPGITSTWYGFCG